MKRQLIALLGAIAVLLALGSGVAQAQSVQGVEQVAGTGQSASSSASSTQTNPSNSNINVRIFSPGDNGSVSQSNNSVAGSVAEGLSARLDPAVPIEDVRLGKFVKIVGQKYEYFCLVTDVQLDSANADVLRDPPGDPSTVDAFLRQVLSGTTTYALIKLKPELMLANLAAEGIGFEEADLVPELDRISHYAWDRIERVDGRGRTVVLKIKFGDFQTITRSHSHAEPVEDRKAFLATGIDLLRALLPLSKGVRLLGLTLANFGEGEREEAAEFPAVEDALEPVLPF